jgi:two-component system, NtrC family, sensor kinase
MFRRNLTAKMLIAVGVTVAVVISIYTYFVIRVQSAWWHERTQAQNVIAASLIHEYLNGVMLSDRHEEVQGFLLKMKGSDEIWRGRLIKPDGTIVFSTDTQEVRRATMTVPPELFAENRVLEGTRVENGQRLSVVMRPVLNSPSCQRCHEANTVAIGAIIVEKSLAPAEASVASNRNLLIVYGIVIFVLVGIVLWLLIVRLVTQPVSNVLEQMRKVQTGDLGARATAETRDEVGELAVGFNAMVQSLDNATRELEESHEKQIQQAGKLASIGELASGIAHEIRNPLAGIGAAVEVLAEENNLNGQRTEIVAEIRRQITRLNRTLHDLLEFARLRDPEITPCDVHGFIRPMLTLVRPDAQKFHVNIEERFAADLPNIFADAGQMEQALLNILLNGVQAMPNGGTLTVSTEPHPRDGGGIVRIKIQDTGVGIERQHLAKIFSPFFTTKHRGTGLGLSITRTIIEKHHGTIAVDSEPGKGTTFTLELAACKPETAAPQAKAETPKEFAHAEN